MASGRDAREESKLWKLFWLKLKGELRRIGREPRCLYMTPNGMTDNADGLWLILLSDQNNTSGLILVKDASTRRSKLYYLSLITSIARHRVQKIDPIETRPTEYGLIDRYCQGFPPFRATLIAIPLAAVDPATNIGHTGTKLGFPR